MLFSESEKKDVFCYVDELTWGTHLRVKAGCWENQPCD